MAVVLVEAQRLRDRHGRRGRRRVARRVGLGGGQRRTGPAGSASVGVHDQVPSAATTAVQTTAPPAETVTVSPATPVPEIAGVCGWSIVDPLAGDVIDRRLRQHVADHGLA